MRFTLGRAVHFYYVAVLVAITCLFAYGVKHYWDSGLLNIDYVSNLYDGTSKVKAVKERNDIEELKKFVDGDRIKDANKIFTRLESDIKDLKDNRIKTLKSEAANLTTFVESHIQFNRIYKEFATSYAAWFKLVEPEIAYKKIQFEKSSQTVFYSLIAVFSGLIASVVLGFGIYNFSVRHASNKTEKLVIDTIKDGLLPIESKQMEKFSPEFQIEFDKYRDYAHKRMAFGSIFQEAMPFASILLDSNLNMIWGNSHFYDQWQLQNFKEDEDSLTWDFLQRFTNLEDNSPLLSALRMSTSGTYKIQVKSNTMASALPYEMHVAPVDYSNQKRIMVIFYPLIEAQYNLVAQKAAITTPVISALELQIEEKLTTETRNELRTAAEKAGGSELFSKLIQYIEKTESIQDELNLEIESLENKAQEQRNTASEIRKSLVDSFETSRNSIDRYNQFKTSVTTVLDTRDQLEEQFRYAMSSSRELFKDQSKILSVAEKAEKTVDEYIKSLKTITVLKSDFKELKSGVDEFKARTIQMLDQLLIFQGHENDTQRVDQFLGKVKIEMKGFEKVLNSFSEVVTQLDITVTKVDMMAESRERIDLDGLRYRMETIKNNLENVQFSSSKIAQTAHAKDDEMIAGLKALVGNLKIEMKRINQMCALTGLSPAHLEAITPVPEIRA